MNKSNSKTFEFIEYSKYKFSHETLDATGKQVLQLLIQSDIITLLFTWCNQLVLVASAANDLAAQHSNTWPMLAIAVAEGR